MAFQMIDVGAKAPTARRAHAQGRIELSASAYKALIEGQNPKGDVLSLAEVAGIMAAKNTSMLLPLCHPLPIEQVLVRFELEPSSHSVWAFCEAAVTAKTGVEMEALAGVNGALLCIYDLSKAVDPVLKISDIRLNTKTGGKSGVWNHPEFADTKAPAKTPKLSGLKVAVLTVSDSVSRREAEDQSGPALQNALSESGAEVVATAIVADDRSEIARAYRRFALETKADIIISTGGTGLSPRDVTPEALLSVVDREIPGFGELLRADGSKYKTTAWLSRSTAGLMGQKIIVALPGSVKAVTEGFAALEALLPHALHTARGGNHAVR